MLSCPSIACIMRKLAPPSSRCVAKEWRKVCGLMLFVIPAAAASSFMKWNTIMRESDFLRRSLMKTKSPYPAFIFMRSRSMR